MPSSHLSAWFTTALLGLSLSATAQSVPLDVDEAELRRNVDSDIEWVNFTGVVRQFDTAAAIHGIGEALGAPLERTGAGRYGSGYSILRAVDPDTLSGFDADILSLEPTARVNHIDNVHRILVGYLEAAHGYSRQDATMLAVFATVYNALLRGDIEYFAATYKPVVMQHIDANNAGIATNYVDWPGKTRLLISLSARAGVLSALSTSELADTAVIEQLRDGPDQGLDVRKDMVDLRERQIDEQQEQLQQDQQAADRERQQLAEEQRLLAEQQERARHELERARTEQERLAEQQRQQELARQNQALAEQQQQADAEAAFLAAVQQDISDQ